MPEPLAGSVSEALQDTARHCCAEGCACRPLASEHENIQSPGTPDLGEAFTLRLCEQLLAADLGGHSGEDGDKSGILLQYVKVRCALHPVVGVSY